MPAGLHKMVKTWQRAIIKEWMVGNPRNPEKPDPTLKNIKNVWLVYYRYVNTTFIAKVCNNYYPTWL